MPENQDNKFLVDWLSFTSKIDSDASIFDVLGLSHIKSSFSLIYGFQGYSHRFYFDGISIHYCHPLNEGIWVEMSGQGCRNFETYSTISFTELFKIIVFNQESGDYHVTRLDVSYDDFKCVIPLQKFAKQVLDFHYVSKFNSKSCHADQHTLYQGTTVYLGSPRSDLSFRIYDKAFERGYYEEIEKDNFSWTRWEAQLRDDPAYNFIKQALDRSVGEIFKGVLLNYFRVVDVNPSDTNKRRWMTSKWYQKFIGDVEKISVFTPCKTEYNLYKCERYVYSQAGNAIDTLIKIKGFETFLSELHENKSDTTLKYKELLNTYLAHDRAEHKGDPTGK